jgi:hypothetical protein
MKHENYKELLELNVLGELSKEDEIELNNHLFECEECSEEYAEIKKLFALISAEKPPIPAESDLNNARKRLFNTINSDAEKLDLRLNRSVDWLSSFSKKYTFGFGTIALVLVGFFVGYLLFNNSNPVILTSNSIDLDKIYRGEVKIANVSFPAKFSDDGEFEIKLDDKNSTTYTGTLSDVVVQKLLAAALNETENPGFKIKTATSFVDFLPSNFIPDEQIKDAFINSLKYDQNPGVRKDALRALINFKFDDEIRDALLFVLEKDENASNRISAINALLAMNIAKNGFDQRVKDKLNNRIMTEENEVVKYRTAKLLVRGKSNEK